MAICTYCGHKVSSGGDRHKKGSCPVRAGKGSARKKRKKPKTNEHVPVRGLAIAGTGKPAGAPAT